MIRTVNTLFMLMSLDGKISSGSNDSLDVDQDFKNIDGLKEGLDQYYEIERTTDLFTLNTGRVMEKIGFNDKKTVPDKTPVSFVIIDNKPHLNENGIKYLSGMSKRLIIVTTNPSYTNYGYDNVDILLFEDKIDFNELFKILKQKYQADRLTIQSGGTLNGHFLREKLIDYVHIVIAPVLVGGKDTPTLVDGESITNIAELNKLSVLELIESNTLENNYIELKYKVIS